MARRKSSQFKYSTVSDVVRGVYYSAKADLKKAAAKGLPTQATITIKRDNNKTIIDKEKLRD